VGRRRRFTKEYRRQVVQETLAPGASVAGVALKHRLNANLVFTWRRKFLPALAPARAKSVKLLPVTITDSSATVPAPAGESGVSNKPVREYRVRGVIEVELNGARLLLKGTVDAEALRVVLAALISR
jgi:transposase